MASMVPVTSVDLAFDDAGSGPAIVLIHGHPFNRSMWAPQVAPLRDRYRVIVPDLRGYGQSPVTPGLVTMAELAADIRGLLDRLGVESAALAGLSMGGLGMKCMGGTAAAIKKGLVKPHELLRYAMSLPVVTTISGMNSLSNLHENLKVARGFQPMTATEMDALRARCAI